MILTQNICIFAAKTYNFITVKVAKAMLVIPNPRVKTHLGGKMLGLTVLYTCTVYIMQIDCKNFVYFYETSSCVIFFYFCAVAALTRTLTRAPGFAK